jgi:hypothetical protein
MKAFFREVFFVGIGLLSGGLLIHVFTGKPLCLP